MISNTRALLSMPTEVCSPKIGAHFFEFIKTVGNTIILKPSQLTSQPSYPPPGMGGALVGKGPTLRIGRPAGPLLRMPGARPPPPPPGPTWDVREAD